LQAADDGVVGLLVVQGGVTPQGLVTAAHVSAGEAEAEVDPGAASLEAFLTAVGSAGLYIADLIQMGALWCHDSPLSLKDV
jgi:hypothetical protein